MECFFHNLSQCFRLIKIFERAASISCCESHYNDYNITQLLWSDKNSFNFYFLVNEWNSIKGHNVFEVKSLNVSFKCTLFNFL